MTGQETPEGPIPWISATAVFSPSVWRLAFFYRAIGLIAYNLNIGMAIHLAAGGYYPIGRAFGLR